VRCLLEHLASRSCAAGLVQRCARDTIGDLRRARHRFDAALSKPVTGLNRPARLAL